METKDGTPADLCDEMDVWHAASNSSMVRLFTLISAYDRDQLWRTDGAMSMPSWLSFRFGLAPSTAREWLRIAQILPELPAVQRQFAEGRLSVDQLSFVCRLASPESDEFWATEAVKYTAPQLELMARRRREITAAESNQAHRQRFHGMRWDPEHRVLRYRGMLPEEQGAILETAINRLVDQAGKDPITGVFGDVGTRAADALVELASQSLGSDSDPDRATVVVHVPVESLISGVGAGEVELGPGLSIETVRRLSCDGRVEVVAENEDGTVVGIGRARRTIPGWLGRSLRRRDQGCRFPGCHHRRWVHGHHIRFWSAGGQTNLDNLIELCPTHHRMVHEEGWRLEGDPNRDVRWVKPDGRR
ncbi:MAG TPA: DUF222 domain-containing protein, partial [Acidimicrobiia bacterium]|nr:DUF222 domain-containing protein [Acidimicrobiia bacterium]